MFEGLARLPDDSILSLSRLYAEDQRPAKIDLGVGVYKTPDNRTPVMEAVRLAETRLGERQSTKAYTPPEGPVGAAEAVTRLALGDRLVDELGERVVAIMTPGGCGALRVGAELLKRGGGSDLFVGAPTWANHHPLLSAAGLTLNMIPYYDAPTARLLLDDHLAALSALGSRDAALFHGACHNPTGADLPPAAMAAIVDLVLQRGFFPFVDLAYHGLGKGLDEDASLARALAARTPTLFISYSCSKNFGLYRERAGALIMIAESAAKADAMRTHALNIARTMYSMPPANGAELVADILATPTLRASWRRELDAMRLAIDGNRKLLVERARAHQLGSTFDFIADQKGMFSLLPVSDAQALAMRERHGVYMTLSGRINLCGVNAGNVDHLCTGLAEVLRAGA